MPTNPPKEQLNNDACALLLHGHVERAWSMMRSALRSTKTFQQERTSNNENENLPRLVKVGETLFREDFSPNNSFQVYRGVFLLSSAWDEATAPAAVLYNAAFTMHVTGMRRASHACLRKAMQLYTLAQSVWDASESPLKESFKVFQVALWTNLAHLHCHFLHAREVRVLAEAILASLYNEAEVEEHESRVSYLIVFHFQEVRGQTCAACA